MHEEVRGSWANEVCDILLGFMSMDEPLSCVGRPLNRVVSINLFFRGGLLPLGPKIIYKGRKKYPPM
jgi:hypothetical protein